MFISRKEFDALKRKVNRLQLEINENLYFILETEKIFIGDQSYSEVERFNLKDITNKMAEFLGIEIKAKKLYNA